MDVISHLGLGFTVALTLQNILYCFIGVLLGTVIGVLPGIGPVTTVAMLLPISFTLAPESALILLAGIYYGAQYGGSTTAILVNIPGEASSVVTTIDGHQMARQGRAGPALGIAAIGSFFAGCVSTLLIALAAPPLAAVALEFGPAEYFSLMACGLIAAVVLARGSLVKAIAMVVLGLLLGLVGTDVNSGARRFNFGMTGLADGVEFVALSMAIYGISEVAYNLEGKQETSVVSAAVGRVWPSLADLRHCVGAILRGTALGAMLGVLPGGGALLASFAAYTLEKNVARPPRLFGRGDIRGVAAPESANNAGAQTSFIPMLTLGIPGNPTMAMMIGALMIHGIAPGPRVMTDRPGLFWGVIASMWIGNLMLVILNLPMVGIWVRLLRVPYRLLLPRHHRVLLHRRLYHQQQAVRRLRDGVLRGVRLRRAQARLRAGAARSRLRAGTDDGGEPAPRAPDLARRPAGVPAGADQPRFPVGGGRPADRARGAHHPKKARGSAAGVAWMCALRVSQLCDNLSPITFCRFYLTSTANQYIRGASCSEGRFLETSETEQVWRPAAAARNRSRGRFREDAPWLECGPGAKKATGGAPRGGRPFSERVRPAPRKRHRAGHGTGSTPQSPFGAPPPPPERK